MALQLRLRYAVSGSTKKNSTNVDYVSILYEHFLSFSWQITNCTRF